MFKILSISEYLEKYLKYEDNVKSFVKGLNCNDLTKYQKIKSWRKTHPIPNKVINLFYDQPNQFFSKYQHLLEKTTYLDNTGNSIFAHYFFILYEKYKGRTSSSTINYDLYESKFDSFFKENEKYFLVQDINLDTPFHKLAKFRNKGFFIEIYNKLKNINMINNELLLTSNIDEKTIFFYIFNDIKYNSNKLSNIEFYYNFINDNKNLVDNLPEDEKRIIDYFKEKVIFDVKLYKKENFNEIYNNINEYIRKKLKNKNNIFEHIYFSDCDINYLNCLFEICSQKEEYEKLFDLVSLLATKKEMNKERCISNDCLVNHIGYVLRKLNRYKSRAVFEMNYAIILINKIFSKIENKESFLSNGERFKTGLLANIEMNSNLNMGLKAKLFDEFSKITHGKSDGKINPYILKCYNLYNALKKNNLNKSNKLDLYKDTVFILKLIKVKIDSCNESEPKQIANYIKEFLDNNHYNIWKYRFDFSNEIMEKIFLLLVNSQIKGLNHSFENDIPDNHFSKKIGEWLDKKYNKFLTQDAIIDKYLYIYLEKNSSEEFFDLLLSCPKDKSGFIKGNSKTIMNMLYDNFVRSEDNEPYKIIHIFQKNLPLLKNKSINLAYYLAYYLTISEVLNKSEILSPEIKQFKKFVHLIKTLNNINLIHLIKDIDEPFDYSGLIDIVNRYILIFCKIFKGKKNMFLGMMKELDPNFNIHLYSKVMDIYEKNCKSNSTNYDIDERDIPTYLINNFIYIMILYYIKKKYEKEIPYLVPFLLSYFVKLECNEIIKLFKNAFNTNNFNNIFDKFIFVEFGITNEKYKCIDYLKNNTTIISNILKLIKRCKCTVFKNCIEYIKHYVNGYVYYDFPGFKGIQISYFLHYMILEEKYLESLLFQLDLSKKITITNIYLQPTILDSFQNIKELKKAKRLQNYVWRRAVNSKSFSKGQETPKGHYKDSDELDNIDENIEEKETNFYFLFEKIFESEMSIFSFLDKKPNILNKNIFNHCASVIEKFANESKNIDAGSKFYFDYLESHPLNDNFINNLYLFLSFIKSDKNQFYDIINDSLPFKKLFQFYFSEVLNYFRMKINSSVEKKKKEFIRNEIIEFFKKDQEFYNKEFFLSEESIVLDFTNSFINKIKNSKDTNDLKRECTSFIRVINNYDMGIFHNIFFKQIFIILENLFEKNVQVCLEFLKNILVYPDMFPILYTRVDLNKRLMGKSISNYVNNLNEIIKIMVGIKGEGVPNINNVELLRRLRKYLILNIIKSKKYELFENSNIKNNQTKILVDLGSSLSMLNDIDSKDGSKYILNKIKTSFCNDDNKLFIEFISNGIRNNYIFEILFKNISKSKDKNFLLSNKKQIILSLFEYARTNKYNYIEQLLRYMNNFISNDEISNLIYPPEGSSDNYENDKMKYLLYHAFSFKSFEAFAVLLNYCPKEKAILELFSFIKYKYNVLTKYTDINYIQYISNSKNLDIIKSLNKFLYNFSLFLLCISNQNDFINSLNPTEKNIYYYYKLINILEITPPLLFHKYINTNVDSLNPIIKELQEKNPIKKGESELEWCIILALYEIKGTPLIPIKKYLPEFYIKIENYCKHFKSLKIPEICLKQGFDIKFHDNFINSLTKKIDESIKIFNMCFNIIFIIEKEYGNILDGFNLYLQKAIYNLINNNRIINIADDNEKFKQFFNEINNFRYSIYGGIEYDRDEKYKSNSNYFHLESNIIFSLKNFNRNSFLIIQKNIENYKREKANNSSFKENIEDILSTYICYLNYIKAICNNIILKNYGIDNNASKKNKNNLFNICENDVFILKNSLFQNNNNELIALLNSIDINQIKYHILEGLKNCGINSENFIDVYFNWIDFYLKQKKVSEIIKDTSNMTLTKYANILFIYCETITKWLDEIIKLINFNKELDKKITINLIENSKRDYAIKNFGQNFYNIVLEYFNYCQTMLNEKNDDFSNFKYNINIYYYFDQDLGNYVETISGNKLLNSIKEKINLIDNFIYRRKSNPKYLNENDELRIIHLNMQSKNIAKLFILIYNYISDEQLNEVKKLFKGIKPIFDKFLENHQNFIENYIQNNLDKIYEFNRNLCLTFIKDKLSYLFKSYVIPVLYANNYFLNYCENNSILISLPNNLNEAKYKQFVDFSELLLEIFKTKYHKDKNLNELFKIRAINYILNNDSSLRLFIDEVYLSIYHKLSSQNMGEFFTKKNIRDTFVIKVIKGKKIGSGEFDELKKIEENNIREIYWKNKNNNQKTKKKKKLKLKLKTTNQKQETIKFSFYKSNVFKREFLPTLRYTGHIPTSVFSCGINQSREMTQSFANEFIVVKKEKKNIFTIEENNIKRKGKKVKEICTIPFVNVFDLMFSVKSIGRNEIVVFKHDISSVLDNYSEPGMFESLLNHSFRAKNDEDIKINFEIIKNYVDENY